VIVGDLGASVAWLELADCFFTQLGMPIGLRFIPIPIKKITLPKEGPLPGDRVKSAMKEGAYAFAAS